MLHIKGNFFPEYLIKKCSHHFFTLLTVSSMVFGCFDGFGQHTPVNSFYLSHDNDFLNPLRSTDQYYSFGITSGYQGLIRNNRRLFPLKSQKSDTTSKVIVGLQLTLKGYTPSRSAQHDINEYERPFAGTFTVRPYLISTNSSRLI